MFEINDLTLIYDYAKESRVYALKEVNLEFPDKGLVGIIGPSGSGKSTLMYCMSTLKKATSGQINYNGRSLSSLRIGEREQLRREEFGFVFQRHFLVSYLTALQNVTVAALGKNEKIKEKGRDILLKLGLKDSEINKRPAKLSGGQRQRIAIARAMMNGPKVIFADEPTASLDHNNAFMVMDVLKSYAKEALVLVITHDRSILTQADYVVEIWDGQISDIKTRAEENK